MNHSVRMRSIALCLLFWGSSLAFAANIVSPFDAQYTLTSLGSPPGVPVNLGGLVFKPGNPNMLLIGGSANNADGKIYSVPLTRDASNHVTGFGAPTVFAAAPNVDGGVFLGPDGNTILYTQFPTNRLGQIPPSLTPNLVTDLTTRGIGPSVGAANFVPPSFPGAGRLKVASYNTGRFYDFGTPSFNANDGTYSFASAATQTADVGNGPEGFVYIKGGSPLIPNDSLLITLYTSGQVKLYDIDAEGNPIVDNNSAPPRLFVNGLTGALGAAVDPLTGDFLFCTFGGSNQVVRVTGFTAPPPEPTPTPSPSPSPTPAPTPAPAPTASVCQGSNCEAATVNAGCAAGAVASSTKTCVSLSFSASAPISTCA